MSGIGFDTVTPQEADLHARLDTNPPIHVAINQASTRLAQIFLYQLLFGDVFGRVQTVALHLMDTKENYRKMQGVAKHFELSSLPFIKEITISKQLRSSFEQADVLILLSSREEKRGPTSYEELIPHVDDFKDQGMALELFAKRSVMVIIAGELANTQAAVIAHYATSIPADNITTVTRLAATRGRAVLASKLQVTVDRVKNVVVWGHSSGDFQRPDARAARLRLDNGTEKYVMDVVDSVKWLKDDFVRITLKLHRLSTSVSLASAIVDHLKDLFWDTKPGVLSSMGVMVTPGNSYGLPPGIFFSLPVTVVEGRYYVMERPLQYPGCEETKYTTISAQLVHEYQQCLKIIAAKKYAKEHPPPSKTSAETSLGFSMGCNMSYDLETLDSRDQSNAMACNMSYDAQSFESKDPSNAIACDISFDLNSLESKDPSTSKRSHNLQGRSGISFKNSESTSALDKDGLVKVKEEVRPGSLSSLERKRVNASLERVLEEKEGGLG